MNHLAQRMSLLLLAVSSVVAVGCGPPCRLKNPERPLPPALSSPDLEKVRNWIAREVANSRIPFCWRDSYGKATGRCRSGYHKVWPICWQNCPSGRTNCGAGCTTGSTACSAAVFKMIWNPINILVTIVSFGTATAGTAAVKTATQLGKIKSLVKTIAAETKSARDAAKIAMPVGTAAYELERNTRMWVNDYVGNFEKMTSPKVVKELSKRFCGAALVWVKEQYALNHLALIVEADIKHTARDTFHVIAGFDPTGIQGTIDAFAHKTCRADQPFPDVTILPAYAPTTASPTTASPGTVAPSTADSARATCMH